METEPIWQYIENSQKSLFRFEGLQDYSAEDGASWVEKYQTTGKLTELPADHEWWKKMKERNERGMITQRVRLVLRPLNDYTTTELAYLEEAARYSGDDIRIIEQENFERICAAGLKDFWMIDDQYVFLMEYGPKGKYLGSEIIKENEVNAYLILKDKLLAASKKI